jgi:hypothetical protein
MQHHFRHQTPPPPSPPNTICLQDLTHHVFCRIIFGNSSAHHVSHCHQTSRNIVSPGGTRDTPCGRLTHSSRARCPSWPCRRGAWGAGACVRPHVQRDDVLPMIFRVESRSTSTRPQMRACTCTQAHTHAWGGCIGACNDMQASKGVKLRGTHMHTCTPTWAAHLQFRVHGQRCGVRRR